jgi:hypothetical protein
VTSTNERCDQVVQALTDAHPQPLTAVELVDALDAPAKAVITALAELDAAGVVTPSTRGDDAVWMLHGPTRAAVSGAPTPTEDT